MPLIHAHNLTKRFGQLTAVDQISFSIKRGECFGFLGPNGAGKTTTMRMIYGFSPPTEGVLSVFDIPVSVDMRAIKKRMGVVPQENNLDPELRVGENLQLYASFFGIPKKERQSRIESLLQQFQLKKKEHEKITNLSGGMKRRLVIARALINNPDLILLDEPTTGLDPQARRLLWSLLQALKKNGLTVLLTTHYMEEAAILCDRLVIMYEGRILEEGTPEQLISKYNVRNLEEVFIHLTGKELNE